MTLTLNSMHEQPFTVLNGFARISDDVIDDSNVIIRDGARKLFGWWSDYTQRHGGPPSRNSFDILSMLPFAAHMFLAGRTSDGGWSYLLQGEEFKRLYNGGFQNNVVTNQSFTAFSKSVPDYLDTVAESRQCRRSYGTLSGAVRNKNTFESIDCPLVDGSGKVSHIIGIAELFRKPEV